MENVHKQSLGLRWSGHVEWMQNQKCQNKLQELQWSEQGKRNTNSKMERAWKERQYRTGEQRPETVGNGGRVYSEPKSTTECSIEEEEEEEEDKEEKAIQRNLKKYRWIFSSHVTHCSSITSPRTQHSGTVWHQQAQVFCLRQKLQTNSSTVGQYTLQAASHLQTSSRPTTDGTAVETSPLTEAGSNPTPSAVSADCNYVIITGQSRYPRSYLKLPLRVTNQIARICMLTACSRVRLEKLIRPQLHNTFLAIHWSRRFITALIKARHMSIF